MSVKDLTHVHASIMWAVLNPKIFDGCMSVNWVAGLHPQNI